MTLIEIILLGYIINLGIFILFGIYFVINILIDISFKPHLILELDKIKNKSEKLNHLNEKLNFFERYKDFFIFLIPYSSILKYYILILKTKRLGIIGVIENNIEELEDKIKNRKKNEN